MNAPTRGADRIGLGRLGEEAASRYLEKAGYRVLERGFRTRLGEIDIIAERRQIIIFAEVKTRRSERFGSPAEAVGATKRRRLTLAATAWLAAHQEEKGRMGFQDKTIYRFDVLCVRWAEGREPAIEHIEDAFRV